jgi:riboflavin synthase
LAQWPQSTPAVRTPLASIGAMPRVVFTGLVESTGTLRSRAPRGPGYRLAVRTTLGPLELGESISVNGACLTVATVAADHFEADVSKESAEKTNLGRLSPGSAVNLERALALGARLGGHWVSGHVDAVVRVRNVLPAAVRPYLAPKGSVALDGISLTVNEVQEASFEVMLIPHTLLATTLLDLAPGRELNLEVDLLARYVVSYLQSPAGASSPHPAAADRDASLIEALKRSGMM